MGTNFIIIDTNIIKKNMSKLSQELIDKMRKANEEYERIESLLTPLGFKLCTRHVFYGEQPSSSIYCGKMEDYQSFIDNIDSIKEDYLNHK